MINLKAVEDCAICMEPLCNLKAVTTMQYFLCCGQSMCAKCAEKYQLASRGKKITCPFCRSLYVNTENDPKAQSQLLMFAEKGKAWAQAGLGDRYRKGEYVEKNMKKAIYYFTLASEQGNPLAQQSLGDIYINGDEGVTIDYAKALHYYKLAAEGGSTMAYSNIGFMFDEGLGVTQSCEKAFHYYKIAADKGDNAAQFNVGVCYKNGDGVEKDISLAIKYYTSSADQGYENAIKYLANVLVDEILKKPKYLIEAIYIIERKML